MTGPFEQQGALGFAIVLFGLLNLAMSWLVVENVLKQRFHSTICRLLF
jgi:hypothetical protein